jgi:hypothetical protein
MLSGIPEIELQDDYSYASLYDGVSTVDFGSTTAGWPVSRSFTIYNYGDGELSLDGGSLTLPVGFSLVGTFPSSVAVYSSASFTIQLDATTAGSYSGSLSFGNNDADENPFDFTVTGQVNAPTPEIEVQDSYGYTTLYDGSSSVGFGSTMLGWPIGRSFAIINNGNGLLTLDAGSLVLPPGFSLTGAFPGTVEPYSSQSFTIQLDATVAGSYSGAVSFGNNDSDENPFDFSVSGQVVVEPEIAVSYSDPYGYQQELYDGSGSVYFESTPVGTPVSRTLVIHNTGTAPLTLDPASLTLPGGFSVTTPCATSVAPDETTNLAIQLDAATAGQFQGTLSLASNDADESPFDIALYGEAVAPQPEIAVRYTGSYGYEQEVYDGYGGVTFPGTTVGTPVDQTLTIHNLGTGTLTLDFASLVLPAGYSVVTPFVASVAPGESTPFTVRLDATSGGSFQGTLSFVSNDADETPFDFTLYGDVAVPEPEIVLRYTDAYGYEPEVYDGYGSVSLGTTALGTPVEKTLTIYNTGSGTLELDPASLTLSAGFGVVSPFAATVLPGGSTTLTIRLDAASGGSFQGTLSFASNDADETPFDFTVYGEVTAPQPDVAVRYTGAYGYEQEVYDGDGSVYFDDTIVGTPSDTTLTIHNLGIATLTLDPAGLSLPPGYSLATPLPSSVDPGGASSFTVRLDAAVSGQFQVSSLRKDLPKMELKGVEQIPPRFWRLSPPEGGRYVPSVSQRVDARLAQAG